MRSRFKVCCQRIMGVIAENGGEVAKKALLSALFKNEDVKAHNDKKGILTLAASDEYLLAREEW